MKVIIIEDEKLSEEHLTHLLKRIDKKIEVVATFESVKKSVEAFENGLKSDLIFSDIHLADGLSFEIFSKVKMDAPIIFTTAYDEYAIKAFKLNSVDYLLKPISIADLKVAIEKFNNLNRSAVADENSAEVIQNVSKQYIGKQHKTRFMVKTGETIVSVKAEDIESVISEDGIVFLFSKGKRYIVEYTLDQFETLIDPELFFRINRKAIVNINNIEKVTVYFNSRLKIIAPGLQNDDGIVSRERVNDFKLWMGK
jgi:DNA-binding LytR/AlgR family response regulator